MEPKQPNKGSAMKALKQQNQATLNTVTNAAQNNWNVGSDYKVLELIGKGAYSVVASGIHIKSGKKVAIKRILDPLAKSA
jgi:mitogen-activated protein kinase 1/3